MPTAISIKGLSWSSGYYTGTVLNITSEGLFLSVPTKLKRSSLENKVVIHFSKEKSLSINGIFKNDNLKNQLFLSTTPPMYKKIISFIAEGRKSQHLEMCAQEDIESKDKFTGFSNLSFLPCSVPEINWDEIQTSQMFLGHLFQYPIIIPGMTGGLKKGHNINRRLAKVASHYKIPMGVGSQRISLENKTLEEFFILKQEFPSLFLIGNLGISELLHPKSLETAKKAVDIIEAKALAIHLNVAQECLQPEGARSFRGFYSSLEKICSKLTVPVLIKEVGCGVDLTTTNRLIQCGVKAIDISGKGGTSWPYIESLRSTHPLWQKLGENMREWGIPTAYCLGVTRRKHPSLDLIATGGIRDGITIAKACGLGATMVGVGLPFMKAALQSEEACYQLMDFLIHGLKMTMQTTNSLDLSSLSKNLTLGPPMEKDFLNLFDQKNLLLEL